MTPPTAGNGAALSSWIFDLLRNDPADHNEEIYEYLAPVHRSRFTIRYGRLQRLRALKPTNKTERGRVGRLVGKAYEHLISGLLAGGQALTFQGNVRTTTSELDFLVRIEPLAIAIPFLKDAGTHLVGEAKCHTKAPKSEWINEMRGILDTHGAKLGLLFVGCTPRHLASDIRVAVALHAQSQRVIVPIGMAQLNEVQAGANFLRVVARQYVGSKSHTSALTV